MDLAKISVIIIAKNAQNTLHECLEGLREFEEVIFLDNESTDSTYKIATKFENVKIYKTPFVGFGPMKNLAISYAKNEWILNIDADEILESSLLEELALLECEKEHIIAIPRKNLYKKEWIRACGWYPDFVLRIFNRHFTQFNDNMVHESIKLPKNARIIRLKNGLRHYACESISSLLKKGQFYSTLWAQQNLHKNSSISKSIVRGAWKFVRDYFFKKGFLYGYKGFIISFCNALGVFFKYAKLYELKKYRIQSCALVITTYNQKEQLALVLDSVKKLLILPDEVLIADDGSGKDTAELIKRYIKYFPCPLKHIWQEDNGFRVSKSRNNAINATHCEYIIMIDGDMILEPHFINDHLNFAKHKVLLQGGRIILNQAHSQNLMNGEKAIFSFKAFRIKPLSRLIYKGSKITSEIFKHRDLIKGIRSCNMSFYRQDFKDIEGFNENFIGWGREDSEFVARFLFNGGELRRLKFGAIAYHIYHKENSRECLETNNNIYLETIKQKKIKWL